MTVESQLWKISCSGVPICPSLLATLTFIPSQTQVACVLPTRVPSHWGRTGQWLQCPHTVGESTPWAAHKQSGLGKRGSQLSQEATPASQAT